MKMKKWERSDNYIGPDYSDYYIFLCRMPDGDLLAESNFEKGLERLGGESETVKIITFGYWTYPFVQVVMIHESDAEKIELANEILDELANYPVLDDEDYYNRVWEDKMENGPDDIYLIYDNGGKTIDRYSVILDHVRGSKDLYNYLGLSDNPDDVLGYSQFGTRTKDILDEENFINWEDLPDNVKEHIIRRLEER